MKQYKKQLYESLKIKDTVKPIIGIVNDEILHPLFFKQFLIYYKLLCKENDNFTALVLSGLFLHLTLESYITWIVRWLLRNINRNKNRRLIKVWRNYFENDAPLNKKIEFFKDAFLSDADEPVINKMKKFTGKLGALRNKIVHGHEFSITNWSNGKIEKKGLAEPLTFRKIDDHYKEFSDFIKQISLLLKKIDMEDMTAGISSKEWVIEYLSFIQKGKKS